MKPLPFLRASLALACLAVALAARAQDLFVANGAYGSILRVEPSGIVTNFATEQGAIRGLAFDSGGNLFAAELNSGDVYRYTPSGVRSTFASGIGGLEDMAFDAAGNLYVADYGGSVFRLTPGGVRSTFYTAPSSAFGLRFDAAGNLYVADALAGSVMRVTPAGVGSTFASGLSYPTGLAFDGAGNLYVGNNGYIGGDGNVARITPTGSVSTFADGISAWGMAVDRAGSVYAANTADGTLMRYNAGGVGSTFVIGLGGPRFMAFAPVPEPAPLVALCLGALAVLRRRKRA